MGCMIRSNQLRARCGFWPGTSGFSLVELLVVVAVIAILLSLIYPLYHAARTRGNIIQCQANMRMLTSAWSLFAVDNDGKMVSSNNGYTNGMPPWCWRPGGGRGVKQAVTDGHLFPYVEDLKPYQCPTPAWPYPVSYSVSAMLNGEQTRRGGSRGVVSIGEINEPNSSMVMIEEDDGRGWLHNSFMVSLGADTWIDFVPGNHMGGDNISFADGHVIHKKWEDPDTLTIYDGSRHYRPDPGSVDIAYLRTIFKPRRPN